MAGRRLFDTRGASEEEIDAIRKLLEEQGIGWYETTQGNWGLGNAALWVSDENDYERAREYIDEFQREWQARVRREAPPAGIRWSRVPALILVIAAIAWVFYKSFQW